MKHFNFFKRRVCSLAALLAMFALFSGSLFAQTTHSISSGSLTIPASAGDYVITGSTTSNRIVVQSGYKGKITLKNVTINIASGTNGPILIEGEYNRSNYDPVTKVDLVLDGTNQILFDGTVAAAIQVNQGAQINISSINPDDNASGKLTVKAATSTTPGNAGVNSGGAAIGAPNSSTAQGRTTLYNANGTSTGTTVSTAGGNIIISSGTITAYGAHGAGIGGGYQTWYDGIIIVTGGVIEARAGRHAAGLGSGCPTGSGVMPQYTDKSAVIALPPCQITAYGALVGNQDPSLALAGAKYITYVNDPAKPLLTIRTEDYEKNANIYLDLSETPGMKAIFDEVHPTFDLYKVWIGKTATSNGLIQLHGLFQNKTTFFTDASSSQPTTLGRPYMPVSKTTSGAETIILPLFEAKISFTDYPSLALIEGYSSAEAKAGAFCVKVEYQDGEDLTDLTYELQKDKEGGTSDFTSLIFLGPDSSTVIPAPTTLTKGDVFYIIAPLKVGKIIGGYTDVILIRGKYKFNLMAGYLRRISAQVVVRDDTDKNDHIKVTADPSGFKKIFPANETVKLALTIEHKGLKPDYDQATVIAKYIITAEANYDAAVATTPIDQWKTLNVPSSEGVGKETIVDFTGIPIGTYYIHWYVVSGYFMAHSKDVENPVRQYGGFGPYNIIAGKTVTYDGNTNDAGNVPVDPNKYSVGDSVTVLGNSGLLTKKDATFIGWSFGKSAVVTTLAEVPADLINANKKFEILTDTTLYAVWATDKNGPDGPDIPGGGGDSIPDYLQFSVTYDGNGNTAGTVPLDPAIYSSTDDIIAKPHGNLERTGGATPIVFAGWAPTKIDNVLTPANAIDTTTNFVREGNTFRITDNTTMYAVWSTDENKNDIPDIFENAYNVTYHGNGNTSGSVPTDATDYLINMIAIAKPHGTLERTGGSTSIVFAGWAPTQVSAVLTAANAGDTTTAFVREGNPFKITGNVTMYAVWSTDDNGNTIPDIFESEYNVTYHANGATGTAPVDATDYLTGTSVTVKANSNLAKTGATFIGWSFATSNLVTAPAEEPTDLMQPGATFNIYSDTTLYAVWAKDEKGPNGGGDSIPDYRQFSVIYNGNGQTSGTAPVDNNLYSITDLIIAKDSNTLARTGGAIPIVFAGWSKTKVNDVLTSATAGSLPADFVRTGDTFTITENTTMYAVWSTDENKNDIPDIFEKGFNVTYDANGAIGTAPVDATNYLTGMKAIAKDKGNLAKDKAIFIGWSFSVSNMVIEPADVPADLMIPGANFTITSDTTLYAVWAQDISGPDGKDDNVPDYLQFAVIYDGNGKTGGDVPEDKNLYNDNMNVTLKDKGNLVKKDRVFLGWNRTIQADLMNLTDHNSFIALNTMKKAGETFVINGKTIWYAVWAQDDNGNGIPDYLEIEITYHWGAMDGTAKKDTVAKDVAFTITDMDFNKSIYGYVLLGWHELQVPMIVTSSAVENALLGMAQFHAIGSSFTPTVSMNLHAIWAIDANNDGYPDYGGSIVRPTSNGTRSLLLSDDATGNETITGARVWAHGSTLYIESDKAVSAGIYTIGGMLYKQMDIPEGMTSEPLKAGIYIVEMEGVRYKVVVK